MKHILRPTLIVATMALALGMASGVQAAQSARATSSAGGSYDKAKVSYIVGYQMVGQLPAIMRDELDPAAVGHAVQEALQGQKPSVTEEQAKATMEPFMANLRAKAKAEYEQVAARNKAQGDAFLAKNRTAPGVKTTASGLQYQVITQGTGARPGPNDTVQIEYKGSFVNGEVFDDSSKHNPPGATSIPLAGVIPGFREGLEMMQVGGHYKLFIPSNLGYGAQPQNGFPPNEVLIFDVTLLKTGPTPAGGAGG